MTKFNFPKTYLEPNYTLLNEATSSYFQNNDSHLMQGPVATRGRGLAG